MDNIEPERNVRKLEISLSRLPSDPNPEIFGWINDNFKTKKETFIKNPNYQPNYHPRLSSNPSPEIFGWINDNFKTKKETFIKNPNYHPQF